MGKGVKILIAGVESLLLLVAFVFGEEFAPLLKLERKVEKQLAWAEFTYNYSQDEWCVNAQRRDAKPGEYIGGCWKTLHEAEQGILAK
jgi:hypothetical protein